MELPVAYRCSHLRHVVSRTGTPQQSHATPMYSATACSLMSLLGNALKEVGQGRVARTCAPPLPCRCSLFLVWCMLACRQIKWSIGREQGSSATHSTAQNTAFQALAFPEQHMHVEQEISPFPPRLKTWIDDIAAVVPRLCLGVIVHATAVLCPAMSAPMPITMTRTPGVPCPCPVPALCCSCTRTPFGQLGKALFLLLLLLLLSLMRRVDAHFATLAFTNEVSLLDSQISITSLGPCSSWHSQGCFSAVEMSKSDPSHEWRKYLYTLVQNEPLCASIG